MATYTFSTLADGQAINFDPNVDLLLFDQSWISASGVRFIAEGANVRIGLANGGRDVVLLNTTQAQLANSNVSFADNSQFLVGDNAPGTANDNATNSLVGSSGGDLLAGLGGADTLNGGAGNDTYVVTSGDVLIDSGGTDTIVTDMNWTLGAAFENLELSGGANLSANGNNLDNLLIGNAGNNYFNARAGNDTIRGGAGNDSIDMSTGGTPNQGFDAIDGGDGIDTVDYDGYARSAVNVNLFWGSAQGGGDAGEGGAGISNVERLIGGAFNDTIVGSQSNNYLDGRGGNDVIDGYLGNDTLISSAGADTLAFSTAAGSANADLVTGFVSGTDRLQFDGTAYDGVGASGAFAAGEARFWSSSTGTAHDANDRLLYNTSTGQLWYDADGNGAGGAQLVATLQGAPALAATDLAVVNGQDSIAGTNGNDSLEGGAGNDTIDGRGGNDTLRGHDGADYLIGGDGNDVLSGQDLQDDNAADTLDGGLGDDVYNVAYGDVILADPGGIDTVYAGLTDWTLGAGLENLDLVDWVGTALDGTGNELNNIIRSATEGGTLRGLGGNDTLVLRQAQNSARAYGGDGNDTLQGGGPTNLLYGEAGNDLLVGGGNLSFYDGGLGNDTLSGGGEFMFRVAAGAANADLITEFTSGTDTIWLSSDAMAALGPSGRLGESDGRFYAAAGATGGHDADDRVIYNTSTRQLLYDADGDGAGAGQLIATLQSGNLVITDIAIEGPPNADLSLQGGAGNDSLSGGFGNDTIRGGAGNDTLSGGAGNDSLVGEAGADSTAGGDGSDTLDGWDGAGGDTLSGGFGDDWYFADAGDSTLADAGGEFDVVFASASWTLGSGIEVLRFDWSGSINADGVGNSLDNSLWGGQGANRLEGMDGDDFIIGGGGIDTLSGGLGNDQLQGSRDGVVDYYLFDVAPGAGNADDIVAFDAGEKILFDGAVYTAIGSSGNFAAGDARFWASSSGMAHDADDRVIYNTSTGDIWYDADGNGAAAALLVANTDWGVIPTLTATDFVVVNGTAQEGINGTAGDDSLTGTAGDDTIDGLDGNDTVDGGAGDDTLLGGAGNDLFVVSHAGGASSGYDRIDGGAGLDWIAFTDAQGPVQINAAAGNLAGPNPGDSGTLTSVEAFSLTVYDDWFIGNASDNTALGMGGNDTLGGGVGNDLLTGDQGNDYLSGADGNDTIDGGADVDTMDGGAGDDRYVATAGDVLAEAAGGGTDLVESFASWALGANFENLTLLEGAGTANGNGLNNVLRGNDSNNSSINGRAGNDTMFGMGGNDVFDMSTGGTSSYGNDLIDGGAGIDSVEFGGNARTAVNINLAAGTASGGGDGGAGSATLASIENALGGNFNDTLIGNAGANFFRGSAGNDTLNGGAGNDRLQGDAGNDAFVFDALGAANSDTVIGFASAADKVHLENAVMTALGATGNFTVGDVRYWEAAGATSGHDANDRVIYNTSNGNLYYDADGSGSGAAQLIATLQGAPAFTDTDVFVI